MDQRQPKRRSKSHIASWFLFAAAGAVLVAMGIIYYQDRQDEDQIAPTPVVKPGANEVVNVVAALNAQDLDVSFETTPHTARSDELSEVGQGLTVDDAPLFIFIYPDVELREEESAELDPATLDLGSTGGTPVSSEPVRIFAGSNIIAALYGADDDTAERVESAIEGLP